MIEKSDKPIVAAFDFDGTLTHHDTLLPFLSFVSGYFPAFCKLFQTLPYFAGFPLGIVSRQTVKEKLLHKFLGGLPLDLVQTYGENFASQVLDAHLKKEGMEKLKQHQMEGHRCILVSANLDVYLQPWARRHGIADVLCSVVGLDQEQRVTGKLKGLNCWGPEKKRLLLELLGPKENYCLYAYGNSRGDREMLELADHPYCF